MQVQMQVQMFRNLHPYPESPCTPFHYLRSPVPFHVLYFQHFIRVLIFLSDAANDVRKQQHSNSRPAPLNINVINVELKNLALLFKRAKIPRIARKLSCKRSGSACTRKSQGRMQILHQALHFQQNCLPTRLNTDSTAAT